MANISIAGDAIVITSTKTLENLKTLEKHNPKALRLMDVADDGSKEEIFRIGTTTGNGSINQHGASFNGVSRDGNGFASITLPIPAGVTNATEYVYDKFGSALMLLNKVEAQIDAALATVAADKKAVIDSIKVIQ